METPKEYKVRGGCYLQDPIDNTQVHEPGTTVFLTETQFARAAHLVEPVVEPNADTGAGAEGEADTDATKKKQK